MTGLDAKKQTAKVKDVLDLLRGNAAKIKTLKEMVTAISSKMNIPVPVSSQVAPDSPLPPPPLPPPICNGGGVVGVPVLSDKMTMLFYGENGMSEKHKRRKEWEVFEANMKEKVASGHQETLNQLEMGRI
ncbi:hypothetical protein CsSME_00001951 [Camellia sinensis var. sinensis]